jgi:hypothetical protein
MGKILGYANSEFLQREIIVRKPHSGGKSGKLTSGDSSIGSNEQRITYSRKYYTCWRYLIGAALLYAFGVILIAQELLYPALLLIACGGACFLIGLRQAEQRRMKLHQDALQKLAAYGRLNDKAFYAHESPGKVVEWYKAGNDILRFEEHRELILIFQINARITRNDLQSYITGWEGKLARKEPFGVLIVQYDEASESDQDIIRLSHQWHRTHKSYIGQYCVGVAVVTISTRLLEARTSAERAIRMWLGCPGKICSTETEAKGWLARQLEDSQKNS